MKKWLKLGALATALALVAIMAFSAVALAKGFGNGPGPAPAALSQDESAPGLGMQYGKNAHGPENSLIAVAAKELGMSQADLLAQLKTKTIAQVAQEKGVALDKIVNAFLAPRIAELQSAVKDGRLTQAQADQMIATMKAHVTAQLTSPWTPQGSGNGTGAGFVDANHDGICDRQQ